MIVVSRVVLIALEKRLKPHSVIVLQSGLERAIPVIRFDIPQEAIAIVEQAPQPRDPVATSRVRRNAIPFRASEQSVEAGKDLGIA